MKTTQETKLVMSKDELFMIVARAFYLSNPKEVIKIKDVSISHTIVDGTEVVFLCEIL